MNESTEQGAVSEYRANPKGALGRYVSKMLIAMALFLFTIQPWSVQYYEVPLQVILVWLSLAVLILFGNRIRHAVALFSRYQWTYLSIIAVSIGYQLSADPAATLRLYQFVTGVILAIIVFVLSADVKARIFLVQVVLVSVLLSTAVVFLQAIGMADWSWKGTLYASTLQKMPSGLESFPVSYSYSVIGVASFVIAAGLSAKRYRILRGLRGSSTILFMLWAFVFLGVSMAQSRSGALGMLAGILIATVLFRSAKIPVIGKTLVYGITLVFLVLIIGYQTTILDQISNKVEGSNIEGRLTGTWSSFVPAILQHPFGVPEEQVLAAKERALNGFSPRNELEKAYWMNQGNHPHNWFLTAAINYGITAAICLALFIVSLYAKGIRYLHSQRVGRLNADGVYIVGCLAALTALLVHSWFHNASLVLGEMRGWIWVGLIAGAMYWNTDTNQT
jgi:hypothetical protein